MKKLYKATSIINAVFVAEESDDLIYLAGKFCDEEEYSNSLPSVIYEEVRSLDDLPKGWSGCELLWGIDEEITVKDWLERPEAKIVQLKKEVEFLKNKLKILESDLEDYQQLGKST